MKKNKYYKNKLFTIFSQSFEKISSLIVGNRFSSEVVPFEKNSQIPERFCTFVIQS
jgi:hypothetical protein